MPRTKANADARFLCALVIMKNVARDYKRASLNAAVFDLPYRKLPARDQQILILARPYICLASCFRVKQRPTSLRGLGVSDILLDKTAAVQFPKRL